MAQDHSFHVDKEEETRVTRETTKRKTRNIFLRARSFYDMNSNSGSMFK